MSLDSLPDALASPEFADTLRSKAGELMVTHPAAATYLVLAAASIAPTCPDEQLVADHYAEVAAPLTEQLARLHHRRTAVARWPLRRRRDGAL
ncbi:hypothetical protein S2M10_24550 [Sphingomonas sp. S2M10]|uniref:hypothetical protein n=1 Tax=Sphingomonas sp. S2M10 TaxID=2705010 RepID=UPI0014570B89|nr:hypothetical protein [Sphingomonas sp. S2M10]NLS27459.1 hypothetical protein [Sphingomonas sp. S2M10]